MAKSSYDFLFCKAQLKWLFNDYLRPGGRSLLHFSPAEDPRMSVTARLRTDIERERLGQNFAGASCPRAPLCGATLCRHCLCHRRRHNSLPGVPAGPAELL